MLSVVISNTRNFNMASHAAVGPCCKPCQALATKVGMTTLAMASRGSMNVDMPETMMSGNAKPVMPLVKPAKTVTEAAHNNRAMGKSGNGIMYLRSRTTHRTTALQHRRFYGVIVSDRGCRD